MAKNPLNFVPRIYYYHKGRIHPARRPRGLQREKWNEKNIFRMADKLAKNAVKNQEKMYSVFTWPLISRSSYTPSIAASLSFSADSVWNLVSSTRKGVLVILLNASSSCVCRFRIAIFFGQNSTRSFPHFILDNAPFPSPLPRSDRQ